MSRRMGPPAKPSASGVARERTSAGMSGISPSGVSKGYGGREDVTPDRVWADYEEGISFKQQLGLFDTVRVNEDFYIGKQWEGVQSNGLPTPVFNFIKRIIMFLVASTATDSLKINASPLASTGQAPQGDVELICSVVNYQFDAVYEQTKMGKCVREFMRAAAVDGDACIYSWFDPDVETGQTARGAIRTELLENTRVIFGNPNSPRVQEQPWIIISRRERVEDVRDEMKRNGGDPESVRSDSDGTGDRFESMADGKVTTLVKFWKDKGSGTIHAVKTVQGGVVRKAWDTGQKLYPIAWMNWEKVQNCCHGQAAVTGLIPNQVFVNKMFAMTMISLMTTAYPKIVYDKTRIAKWDSGVGKAIPVNGGDVSSVARAIDPAAISPQVSQFIELAISLTKEFMGATDAALGNTRPDNTSAIIALQKASQVPMELTKQDLLQCLEDVGNIWLDLMRVYYGQRYVELPLTKEQQAVMTQMGTDAGSVPQLFDFSVLERLPLSIKLDVGGSAYWSEIAQMNTLDNLLTQGHISIIDYLERVPSGYISHQQELIDALKERQMTAVVAETGQAAPGPIGAAAGGEIDQAIASGYQTLARKAMEQDAGQMMQ